jgi:translation elongation factor EF-Ts
VSKVVEGRLVKWYEEVVLGEQGYVLEEGVNVAKVVDRWAGCGDGPSRTCVKEGSPP